jgi:hypothetical protein
MDFPLMAGQLSAKKDRMSQVLRNSELQLPVVGATRPPCQSALRSSVRSSRSCPTSARVARIAIGGNADEPSRPAAPGTRTTGQVRCSGQRQGNHRRGEDCSASSNPKRRRDAARPEVCTYEVAAWSLELLGSLSDQHEDLIENRAVPPLRTGLVGQFASLGGDESSELPALSFERPWVKSEVIGEVAPLPRSGLRRVELIADAERELLVEVGVDAGADDVVHRRKTDPAGLLEQRDVDDDAPRERGARCLREPQMQESARSRRL